MTLMYTPERRNRILKGRVVNPVVLARLVHAYAFAFSGSADRPHALVQHQPADRAEEDHVAHLDDEIDLSEALQKDENIDSYDGTDEPAAKQGEAHLEIHAPPALLGECANH